jgi:hypothetical protein
VNGLFSAGSPSAEPARQACTVNPRPLVRIRVPSHRSGPAGCSAQPTFTSIPEAELQRTGWCGLHGPGPAGAPCSAWQAARACVLRPTLAGDRRRTVTRGVLNASQVSRRQAGREWGLRPHTRTARPLDSEVPERRATGERSCGRCAAAPVAVRWWPLRAQAPFADRLSAGCLVVDQAAVGRAPPRSPASVGRRTRPPPARCRSGIGEPVRNTPTRKRSQRPTAMRRNPHCGFRVVDRDWVSVDLEIVELAAGGDGFAQPLRARAAAAPDASGFVTVLDRRSRCSSLGGAGLARLAG